MKVRKLMILALAAVLLLSGCTLFQVNADRDGAVVVATVGDESITKKEVYDALGIDWNYTVESWEEEALQQQKISALDQLVAQQIQINKAEELGLFEFTEEELAEIEEEYNTYISAVYDNSYEAALERAGDSETAEEDAKAEAEVSVQTYLTLFGMTPESFKEELKMEKAMEKLQDSIFAGVEVTADEVTEQYTGLAYNQAVQYTTADLAIAAYNAGEPLVYYPEETLSIKHILVALDDESRTEITTLRNEGDDAAADALREEAAEAIRERAEEVLQKLADGEDFDALMQEYNEDTGMEDLKEYLVSESYTGYIEGFQEGALTLEEVGDYTDLVLTDYGYHIILLTAKMPEGVLDMEACYDDIEEMIRSQKEETIFAENYTQWYEAANVKTYYDRLK